MGTRAPFAPSHHLTHLRQDFSKAKFGEEHNVAASYDEESRELVCASPATASARLVPLEVSLNNRADSWLLA